MNDTFHQYIESKRKWIDIINGIQSNLFLLNEDNYQQAEEALINTHFSSSRESTINFLDLVIIAMKSRPKKIKLYKKLLKNFEKSVQRYKINDQTFYQIHPQQPDFFNLSFFESDNNQAEINDSDVKNVDDKLFQIIFNDDIDKLQYMLSHFDLLVNSTINIGNITTYNFFMPGTRISLIDLASYFASIKIFKFLFLSNAALSEDTLSYAIYGGCPEIIHILEEKKKLAFQLNKNHLIIAIQTHQQDIIEYIINNIEKNENECITPYAMLNSIEFYNLDFFVNHINGMVKLLEEKGDVVDDNGFTLLHSFSKLLFDCLRCKHVDMLDILLHTPLLNMNVKNVLFEGIEGTIIHAAARVVNYSYMKYILNCDRINVNSLTSTVDKFYPRSSSDRLYAKGLTALHIAVLRRDPELVKILLQSSENTKQNNELNNSSQSKKLNNSVQSNNEIELNKLNPNAIMPINNETPLHFACRNSCKEIIRILVNDPRTNKNSIRIPKYKFFDGRTPADICLMHFDMESFNLIRRAGGRISKQFFFIFLFQFSLFIFSICHISATLLKKANFNIYLTILEVGTIFRFFFSSINDDIFDNE